VADAGVANEWSAAKLRIALSKKQMARTERSGLSMGFLMHHH
jgi:hypothetical protein